MNNEKEFSKLSLLRIPLQLHLRIIIQKPVHMLCIGFIYNIVGLFSILFNRCHTSEVDDI